MQNDINRQVAARLAQLIKESGLKVSVLASTAQTSVSNLYSILRGDTMPTLYTLIMLCKGLHISLSQFFMPLEMEVDNYYSMETMQLEKKLMGLSPKNRKIAEEMLEVLLKYP